MSFDWTLESGTVIRHDLLPIPSLWKLYCWTQCCFQRVAGLFHRQCFSISFIVAIGKWHAGVESRETLECRTVNYCWNERLNIISLCPSPCLCDLLRIQGTVLQVSPEGYATCNNGTRKSVKWLHSTVLVPWRRCCYITLTSALWIQCPVLHVDQQALVSRVGEQTSC